MVKNTRYRVRFHLGKGPHFGHWQITEHRADGTKHVQYFDPQVTQLWLFGAKLRNQRATAKKIHAGAHKKVCAWIEATNVWILSQPKLDTVFDSQRFQAIRFNPKIAPHWTDAQGGNLDGQSFDRLVTFGKGVFADGV